MSTPISRGLLAAVALALAGCDGGFVGRSAPAKIQLPDGTVIAGAEGWCIDETTSKAGAETAVVVLGSCAAIARNARAPRPDVPGVVTVALERETGAVPSTEELAGYLATESGRSVLAQDGRAESVTILETVREEDRLFLRVSDRSAASGTASDTWRALFDLGGRFASVSLISRAEAPIERSAGLATLDAQVARLRAANR